VERTRGRVVSSWVDLSGLPIPLRTALLGGAGAAALGGIVGLVLGLRAYPPTAWFAIVEVAVPAALLGSGVGLVAGLVRRRGSKGRSRLPDR
jgi:hypothetical protein